MDRTRDDPTQSFWDDIMNKRLRLVLRRLWSFHINLKLQFNLDFKAGEKANVSSPIPSPPWPRINTQILFCQPATARTRELHSAPNQVRYKLIPTPDRPQRENYTQIRWNAGEKDWCLACCFRSLCKNTSTADGFSWLLCSWITSPAPE